MSSIKERKEKAQQEFQNPNKERTYAALRKQQDIFYLSNYENKLARNLF